MVQFFSEFPPSKKTNTPNSKNSGQKEPLSGMSIFKFQFHFSIFISSKPMWNMKKN